MPFGPALNFPENGKPCLGNVNSNNNSPLDKYFFLLARAIFLLYNCAKFLKSP